MKRISFNLKVVFSFFLFILSNSFLTKAQVKDTLPLSNTKGIYISAGYGAISLIGISQYLIGVPPNNHPIEAGPLYLKFEKRMKKFGIGINLAYLHDQWSHNLNGDSIADNTVVGQKVPVTGAETDKRYTYSLLIRLNYYFVNTKKFDVYYGFGIGARISSLNRVVKADGISPAPEIIYPFTETNGIDNFPLGFECSLGAKYFISPRFAFYAEAGFCKSIIQAGITYNISH